MNTKINGITRKSDNVSSRHIFADGICRFIDKISFSIALTCIGLIWRIYIFDGCKSKRSVYMDWWSILNQLQVGWNVSRKNECLWGNEKQLSVDGIFPRIFNKCAEKFDFFLKGGCAKTVVQCFNLAWFTNGAKFFFFSNPTIYFWI